MKKEKFPRMLSKNEVQEFISSGLAVYDSALSKAKNLEVYQFADGRLIFKRSDGKGTYWKSLEQINEGVAKSERENEVLNMNGWIKSKNDLPLIGEKSLNVLKEKTRKSVDYSNQSLSLVNKIKVKNLLDEKNLFYALVYYSCEYCAKKINGSVDIEQINGTNDYRPIVKNDKNRIYIPYSEFLKSLGESKKITIDQSIEIEIDKYRFSK